MDSARNKKGKWKLSSALLLTAAMACGAAAAQGRGPGMGSCPQGSACGAGPGRGQGGFAPGTGIAAATPLSTEATQDLMYMQEEERLARDLYTFFYSLWQAPVFQAVVAAEERHMSSVAAALDRHGLPRLPETPGTFQNEELQSLYDRLAAQGARSLTDALLAAAYVEELDIEDLSQALTRTAAPDLVQVYQNLARGSRNHLRLFAGYLGAMGVSYTPQVLEPQEVQAILQAPIERGGRWSF